MRHAIFGSTNIDFGKKLSNVISGVSLTAVLVILMASCNTTPETTADTMVPNDLVSENTHGTVTQIETESYPLDSTGTAGPMEEKYMVKYDSLGFVNSEITTNDKDSVITTATYTHLPNGLFSGQTLNDANGKKKSSLTIEYDSAGKPTIAKSYDSTGKMDMYFTDIVFNKFAKVVSGTGYHLDSTVKMSFQNDYDSIYYVGGFTKDSTGKTTYSSKLERDSSYNPVKMEATTVTIDSATKKDVTRKSTTVTTYTAKDSHGNWTEQTEKVTGDDPSKKSHNYKRIITYME